MKKASVTEQFVVDSQGKRTAVILPIKRYRRLLEDIHDLVVIAERKNDEPISVDAMKHRLKKHGLI